MKIKIIGSGGCVSTPRPCCNCPVCVEAREKGFPYARTGCSLFIEDENILIDTPEDINYSLNNANIQNVECIMYSHCDPDHTMGMRVLEQLRMDWLKLSVGVPNSNPILVTSLPTIMDDIVNQRTKYGSVLKYYEYQNLATIKGADFYEKNDMKIDFVPINEEQTVTIFVITKDNKKVIYAPCDVKPFPNHPAFENADVLIIGNTVIGNTLKNGFVLTDDNPLRQELFTMDEILDIKAKFHIPKVIMTHIEEDWGKSYDDYKQLEKEYDGISFAFDGMEICL